jgi:DNA-binding NtrC family response regulator
LHQYSGRPGKFVALNCGALAGEMAGSQLFGHDRGSFTGAVADHAGVFEQAHRGTLFLDEFTEMPAQIQTYLLRILEAREVTRLGAHACRALDVRVIAASNRDPQEAIQSGVLRADLYYRLAEFAIFVPPLRARMGDVDLLAQHFVDQLNGEQGVSRMLSPESRARLHAHSWPGNVRELRHVICRAHVMADGAMLEAWPDATPVLRRGEMDIHPGQTLEDIERRAIMLTLDHFGSDRARAADALGISVKTIYNKLARYRNEGASDAA